jgi:transposase
MGERKFKNHVKGSRGEEFREKIKGLKAGEIIGVAIDVSRSYYRVMVFNFDGEVLRDPFDVDVFKGGYYQLMEEVKRLVNEFGGRKVFWAMEPTACYHHNLARHLVGDGEEVIFLNPSQVASNRDQRMLYGLKGDDIDLGAIADLLIRGEGYFYNLDEGVYLGLKERTWWREKKLKMQTQLKNQIRARLERIFPGLSSKYGGNQLLISDLWGQGFARGLMKVGLTPRQILQMPIRCLKERFKDVGHPISTRCVERMKAYFGRMLLPEDEVLGPIIELLRRDVRLLEALELEMGEVEGEMIEGVKKTPWSHLLGKIKGIGDIMVASFAGAVGDITKYSWGSQIFRKSGLDSKSRQSGEYEAKGLPIRRMGSRLLRCILYKMAGLVIKDNPYFGLYYEYLVGKRKKLSKKAHIAVANKLTRVMFALVRDRAEFSPPTAKIDYLEVLFSKAKKERRQRRDERRKKREKASHDSNLFYGLEAPSLGEAISLNS